MLGEVLFIGGMCVILTKLPRLLQPGPISVQESAVYVISQSAGSTREIQMKHQCFRVFGED